jgi:hypothetical protein
MARRTEIPYPALGLLWPERSIAQSLLQHYDVDPDTVPMDLLQDFAQTVGEELLMLARDYLGERGLLKDEEVLGGVPVTVVKDGPPIACVWCVQAEPGLICQSDLGGQCPSVDLGGGGRPGTASAAPGHG